MNREEKAKLTQFLHDVFKRAKAAYLVEFRGLKVADATELRRQIKRAEGYYRVVKNTLALRAIGGTKLEPLRPYFRGTTAIAYSLSDGVSLAKALTEFAKNNQAIAFKAGVIEGKIISGDQIEEIAKLPSRQELLAKLMFTLNAPLARLASALQAPLLNLAYALKQIQERK